jgi:hypothetical protein
MPRWRQSPIWQDEFGGRVSDRSGSSVLLGRLRSKGKSLDCAPIPTHKTRSHIADITEGVSDQASGESGIDASSLVCRQSLWRGFQLLSKFLKIWSVFS